ncbi:MAG: hypothetical protein JRN39_02960 [Nitrososphaerota archaeon]|nr:hypothetical protein [Nitrososphaerota archaeon]MDG6939342.1 hypothetical protein [Nitrososphaerota archaeon]
MSSTADVLRLILTNLVDAVRYSENAAEAERKAKETREKGQKQLYELDGLATDISQAFDNMTEVPEERKQELFKNVMAFASIAIEQTRSSLAKKLAKEAEDLEQTSVAEKTRFFKSLESFFAASPLPVLDRTVNLKFSGGAYSAVSRYRCEGAIEYEFTLNTSDTRLFRREFLLAAFRKDLKLPVRLSKTWLRKEQVPDYERLDQYVLVKAEAATNHLMATFTDPKTEATVDVVYSRSGNESFITAEYSDPQGKVLITSEPLLSKHLDLAALKGALNQLLRSVLELESRKLGLTRLYADDQDALHQVDSVYLLRKVLKVVAPEGKISDEALRGLDVDILKERIRVLGSRGGVLVEALGLRDVA